MYTVPSGPILGELYPKLEEESPVNEPTWLPFDDKTHKSPDVSPI